MTAGSTRPTPPKADLRKRTLTNLYNARLTWLADAHRALDAAVFAAYGWPPALNTPEILTRLLALNHARAAAQPTPSPTQSKEARAPKPRIPNGQLRLTTSALHHPPIDHQSVSRKILMQKHHAIHTENHLDTTTNQRRTTP